MGIEPTLPAWEAGALPLCYARTRLLHSRRFAAQIKPKLVNPLGFGMVQDVWHHRPKPATGRHYHRGDRSEGRTVLAMERDRPQRSDQPDELRDDGVHAGVRISASPGGDVDAARSTTRGGRWCGRADASGPNITSTNSIAINLLATIEKSVGMIESDRPTASMKSGS